ncbi:holo-ACP synthase [Candidatus Woesearchaeota archaeon]|nr:holo-ACP synthase [Candidatus Woesearchaeota archaeon]
MEIKNFAIGTDIESIGRFRKLNHTDHDIFLNKVFTKNELDYCFSKEVHASCLAARYAGKEAIVKALSSMGKASLDYKALEIFNNEKGVPIATINDIDFRNLQVHLSLSHCGDKAIAFAVVIEVD